MKKYLFRFFLVMIAAILLLSGIVLVRHRKAQLANKPTPTPLPVAVYTKSGQWGRLSVTQHFLGTITPQAETTLSAQITGYITKLHKDVGDRLQKGEVAAKIDTKLLEAQEKGLSAELSGARDDLSMKEKLRIRRQKLIQTRAISQEVLDEADLAVSLAESRVRRLEQELSMAKVSLSFSKLESFSDGIITERMKDTGDLVTTGTPVFRIENPDQGYKVLIQVPQETAAALARNTPARLVHGNKVMDTTVDRVHPAIVSGHLATVEIRLPNRPFDLPSYSVVAVDLTVDQPEGWIVDADCLLETGSNTLMYPVSAEMKVAPVEVTVLGLSNYKAVVDGPLAEDSSFVSGPESMLLTLGPGRRVLPIAGSDQ